MERLSQQPAGFLRPSHRSCRRAAWAALRDPLASQLVRQCYSSNSTRRLDIETLQRVSGVHGCSREKNRLWMVLMVRNEAHLLIENLLYHLALGVDHFLVYDDHSADNLRPALQPFVDAGLATHIPVADGLRQLEVYDAAVAYARDRQVRWLAVIDVDEFFVSARSACMAALLEEVYRQHVERLSIVAINWRFVHTDVFFDDRGMFQAERANDSVGAANFHVKAIVIPNRVGRFTSPHDTAPVGQWQAFSPGGREVNGPFLEPPDAEDTALLHFHAQSPAGWIRKRIRGRADFRHSDMEARKETFLNDDAMQLLQEWSTHTGHAAPPDHPLEKALRETISKLRRALDGL
ncbi:hypothetical protein CDCA_CDCA20G4864 [Cyanidium caldarium]|uniref:Glycosyltransferase family 92 protein n=1 Tax=Cyanidium caldarium TaxID=2771 RepID=A0AAV9J2R5_CYACA|nr:hypothetical protein CDCA_CDCA20G4864 [Cyanidium caldarium]